MIKGNNSLLKPICPECKKPMSGGVMFWENQIEVYVRCQESGCKIENQFLSMHTDYDSFYDKDGNEVCTS